jgi:DNA sulfur modification protein DndC
MKRAQSTLFEEQRMGFLDAQELSIQSLLAYAKRYRHWAIAYSGGKDSSAVVTFVCWLILTGQIPKPESLTILYADTRMELTPLHASAMAMLAVLKEKGFNVQIVLPKLDDRFFVYMFGRGVPPPKNRFRWCTAQIKIEPMLAALAALRSQVGEKFLMLTGVRLGESAARDSRIALSCSRDGAECGQGWFQESTPEQVADTLAPLIHWRVCFVWDWLYFEAPTYGFPTARVAEAYGGDEAEEINARTGCVGCNLASKDVALETILKNPDWTYLAPLRGLRPLYAWLIRPGNRLRKNGERLGDGRLSSNPMRMGPLTMAARLDGLRAVLKIQRDVNSTATFNGRPLIDLINAEEEDRIRWLIDGNTWPDGWTGTEPIATEILPEVFPDGSIQDLLIK